MKNTQQKFSVLLISLLVFTPTSHAWAGASTFNIFSKKTLKYCASYLFGYYVASALYKLQADDYAEKIKTLNTRTHLLEALLAINGIQLIKQEQKFTSQEKKDIGNAIQKARRQQNENIEKTFKNLSPATPEITRLVHKALKDLGHPNPTEVVIKNYPFNNAFGITTEFGIAMNCTLLQNRPDQAEATAIHEGVHLTKQHIKKRSDIFNLLLSIYDFDNIDTISKNLEELQEYEADEGAIELLLQQGKNQTIQNILHECLYGQTITGEPVVYVSTGCNNKIKAFNKLAPQYRFK